MTRDLLHSDEIKDLVRTAYRDAGSASMELTCKLYDESELRAVPRVAAEHSFGVANHLRRAELAPGETVLDIGCGWGMDSILAARRVSPGGRVLALDFLPEMLERTANAVAEAGLDNVVTVEGEMEAIPLPDDSVDHIISNGVINLSPRKGRVFRECARVLKPGGKFCVSDLTIVEEELPPEILVHPAAWAG